jgi:hypothetical protein
VASGVDGHDERIRGQPERGQIQHRAPNVPRSTVRYRPTAEPPATPTAPLPAAPTGLDSTARSNVDVAAMTGNRLTRMAKIPFMLARAAPRRAGGAHRVDAFNTRRVFHPHRAAVPHPQRRRDQTPAVRDESPAIDTCAFAVPRIVNKRTFS